jgi:hypothetical protein
LAITSIVFASLFCGALLGMFFRATLPDDHLSSESRDVIKLGMGLVATMSALVLGLLIASAKSSYDDQKSELNQISANLILLDSALAQYGPEAQETRDLLRRTVASAIERIWPQSASPNLRI